MHIFTLSSLILLLGIASADKHDYCACQYGTNKAVDPAATSSIAGDCTLPYTYGQKDWEFWIGRPKGSGPRFQGAFLKAINGQIDGDAFHAACLRNDGHASTCFNCKNHQYNDNGSILCQD
ncbi:hypothetical protein BDZ85DRAFT_37994 [Elsinoe ampelina]|uniref:Cyanovirin-N domain-containing protein n=1 Tax=Elsinoe ampelina TaxID=302913 RepID=A0A6A6G2P3_9PEZI|nr:hypothetical protein BDZ85DRAFT_37994 [Elsinoe ampelina]